MAGSLNRAFLIGNLGADPDIRTISNGSKIAQLSIATSETWKDKNTGEKHERTQWHRVVIFNEGLVGVVEKYAKKGSKIFVEGQIETRQWEDQSGVKRYTTEIVLRNYGGGVTLLDRANGGPPPPDENAYGSTSTSNAPVHDDFEDDIPF